MLPPTYDGAEVLARMADAVDQVQQRLIRAATALQVVGVPYAVVDGNAVAAWVATIDRAAVRNTQDVDILIRRSDFDAARTALERAGFVYRHAKSLDMFLDGPGGSPRDAVHLLFAREVVSPDQPEPHPDVEPAHQMTLFRAAPLDALVRMKLASFRRKDHVHLLDLLSVNLIDQSWVDRLPRVLAQRLQSLIDSPDQ